MICEGELNSKNIWYSNNFVATVANKECLLTKLTGNKNVAQSKNVLLKSFILNGHWNI